MTSEEYPKEFYEKLLEKFMGKILGKFLRQSMFLKVLKNKTSRIRQKRQTKVLEEFLKGKSQRISERIPGG